MQKTAVLSLRDSAITSGTALTYTDGVDVSGYEEALVFLNATAKTGTSPTLDVKIQGSWDGTTYCDFPTAAAASSPCAFAFAQLTTTGTSMLRISNFGKFIRLAYQVGGTGTPTYTFEVQFVGKRGQ
jgi:hypothetical protein